MSDDTEIHAGHPLWAELRNGLLWHRTGAKEYRQIRADGFIKPNDGQANRWGRGQYACQQLGGLSLFDFTTEPEAQVLGQATKWQQFLGDVGPVTVLLGLDQSRLGKLIRYPDNKQGTTGNVIPWVEVCHCGPIPLSAIVSYLLVCPVAYRRFCKLEILDEPTLGGLESEYGEVVRIENEERAKQIEAFNNSPALKEAKRRIEEMRRQPE